MREDDIRLLQIELPEDILKAKWAGDFDRALRLIRLAQQNDKTPDFLKQRLLVEQEILERLPKDYSYRIPEAVKLVQQDIPDFTEEELETWMDRGAIDWIYVGGQPCLATRFYETLLDVQPTIAQRAGKILENYEETPGRKLLNRNMSRMKAEGREAYHIRLRAEVGIKDQVFTPGKVLVHLPIPKPQQNMRNIRILRTFPENNDICQVHIGAETDPQRTVSFREKMRENHPFWVEYEYDSVVEYTDLTAMLQNQMNVPTVKEADTVTAKDLSEVPPHIRFTPTILALRDELTRGLTTDLQKARAFYDYCTTRVTYSYMRQYFTLEEIPEYAALGLKGDCGVQALLFITLCRSAGIPARWQSGLYVTPAITEDGTVIPPSAGMHDWALFYLPETGWVFADCSFGGSAYRAGNTERWNYYFGNLDPYRMAANDEYQGAFIPPKQQTRIDPYDNQVGEVEYEDRPLMKQDFTRQQIVLEHYEI